MTTETKHMPSEREIEAARREGRCEGRNCDADGVGWNDDGQFLCEECLMEWAEAEFADQMFGDDDAD